MKFGSFFSAYSLLTASAATASSLRSSFPESSCNQATDSTSCVKTIDETTGERCEWCEAGAIPSECMSHEQAKQLPAGVFDCQTPAARAKSQFVFKNKVHSLHVNEGHDDICDASSKSIAGYMDIKGSEYDANGEDKHLFFWMFEKRESASKDNGAIPLIVWLTGGPGCSSTLALLTENGPCSVNPDGKSTTVNPHSWTETAHVLWLDQPAGVGFSYGQETDANEQMVAEDAYYFLQAFFQTYPEYQESPLYIVGESYAGHYVPSISHRIYRGNEEGRDGTIQLPYAGLAIGNGLTSPEKQYPAYPDMVWNNSHGIKVVDKETYQAMKDAVPRCVSLIQKCNEGDSIVNTFACQTAFLVCNTALTSPYQMTGLNPYDIRKKCDVRPLCYDFSHVSNFLNREETKKALHVDEKHSHTWESCNFGINMKFHTDWMKDFSGYVAELLNAGYPALIYVGDVDFICNYIGNEKWTYELEWIGKKGFQGADVHEYFDVGKARTSDGFTFLQVYDAGHMVPTDQPKRSLQMIQNFVTGGKF
ncbi:cathepsin A [Fistulifera solaris]|uniref:Carboxypeptidase n=1 Tax=Fistulifera solaris TaxID=1519565 RepID=A0A1Z5KAG0_FISSO|nr:cathepsin A [Fistulifera solaris]|eukprot:GAX23091.1 cathepsin A [Fistulifera solaris]